MHSRTHNDDDTRLPLQGTAKGSSKASWKLAFSGDCRPCPAVITNAKDADLLIHEVGCLPSYRLLRHACTSVTMPEHIMSPGSRAVLAVTHAAVQATFEDALLEEALAKKHSLTREAIEVDPSAACVLAGAGTHHSRAHVVWLYGRAVVNMLWASRCLHDVLTC